MDDLDSKLQNIQKVVFTSSIAEVVIAAYDADLANLVAPNTAT